VLKLREHLYIVPSQKMRGYVPFLPVINKGIFFILELKNCDLQQLQEIILQNCQIVDDMEKTSDVLL